MCSATYVQAALELAVAAQLDDDELVDAQAHEVEGLVGLVLVVHDGRVCVYVCGWGRVAGGRWKVGGERRVNG